MGSVPSMGKLTASVSISTPACVLALFLLLFHLLTGSNCNLSEVMVLAQKNLSEKEGNPAPVPPGGSGEDYRWAHRDFNVDLTAVVLEAVSVIGVVAYGGSRLIRRRRLLVIKN